MRKNLHVLLPAAAFLIFSLEPAIAQNSSPYWSLAGNSNATTSSKLGTTNAIPLRILTNNVERLRVDATGKLGIGTTAPAAPFDLRSTANLLARFNGGSQMYMGLYENSTQRGYLGSFAGAAADVDFGTNTGNTTGSVHLTTTAVPRLTVTASGNVGIGTTTPSSSYKLHVVGKGQFTTGLNVGNGGIFGYNSSGAGVYGSGSSWGVYGTSPGIGVYGASTSSSYGVYGTSGYIGIYGNGTSYGLWGNANTTNGWGVYGNGNTGVYGNGAAYGTYGSGGSIGVYGTGPTYAVYGFSSSGRGVYGYSTSGIGGYFYSANHYGLWAATGKSDNYYAAVFDGNTYCYNSYLTSDKALKQNVAEFGDALGIINKLKPRYYEFRHDGKYAAMNLPRGKHYGLIAQELEEVLPNLVKEAPHQLSEATPQPLEPLAANGNTPTGAPIPMEREGETSASETIKIKAVNYTELIPILVKGMQELSEKAERVDALEREVAELKQLVSRLSESQTVVTGIGMLEQNTPNPVSGTTSIRYTIPEASTSARLTLTNIKGQVVKTMTLSNRGVGQLSLNTQGMASGTYNYTLYVDGKAADTKRLIVVR